MRVILTIKQLTRLLAMPDIKPKYPITLRMGDVSEQEFTDLLELLKKKG